MVSGCSSSRRAAAANAHACTRGKLESTSVDAVAVMLSHYKPVSVIALLVTDEINTRKPKRRARAGLECWGDGGGDFSQTCLPVGHHTGGGSYHGGGALAWGSWAG